MTPKATAAHVLMILLGLGLSACVDGRHMEVMGRDDIEDDTPSAVLDAVARAAPGGVVAEVECDDEDGVRIYDVDVRSPKGRLEVEVSAEGVVIEIEQKVGRGELPSEVAATLANYGRYEHLKKSEIHAERKVVALDRPETRYSAVVEIDGRDAELTLDASGRVVSQQFDDEED